MIYLALLFVLGCASAPSTDSSGGPKVAFDPPVLVTTADSSGYVTAMVKVLNIGTDTVRILGVKGSCGCAGASVQRSTAVPDKPGAIYLTVNTRGFVDSVNNVDFTLTSTATNSPTVFRIVVKKNEERSK